MAIFKARESVLKVEYPAGSAIYTTVAYLTQADLSQSAGAVVVSDLLFHDSEKFATDDTVNSSTISASGYAANDFASTILERLFQSRIAFFSRFYTDATTYWQASAKITSLAINASKSGPVNLSVTMQLANIEASA